MTALIAAGGNDCPLNAKKNGNTLSVCTTDMGLTNPRSGSQIGSYSGYKKAS
jgi:hypothetical protein